MLLTDQNILYILVVSVFLPYVFTGIILVSMAIYLCISPKTNRRIFVHKGSRWLILFFLEILIVPVVYKNWIGLAAGFGLICILILGLFARSAMTIRIYERMLNIACLASVPVGVVAIIERICLQVLHDDLDSYRCISVFFNANYFATVVATVIIICAYKVGSHQGHRLLYFSIAAFNMISAYLSGSLFVWVEIFIGVALVFFLMRKHEMLSGLLLGGGLFCFMLYFAPGLLLPRLTESPLTTERRLDIWSTAVKAFFKTPLFGEGAMTYYHVYQNYEGSYPTTHAHNLYLDPLLSFGLVGTALLMIYVVSYMRTLIHCLKSRSDEKITVLICAVIAAALIHGVTDLTLFWIQTGLFFVLVLSGLNLCTRRAGRTFKLKADGTVYKKDDS